jgi:hypothetical protein
MNLAGALRYDAWMYVPLLAAVPAVLWRERAAGLRAGVVFGALCLPFPLFWMTGNAIAHGDALYPLTYIDAFHKTWAEATPAGWPRLWLRLQGIGFWPAMALFTLTPGVAAFGAIGMATAWREKPQTSWLAAAAILPAAYYAFRTTVLFDFVPLGRFTVVQLALLLPFVTRGFDRCTEWLGAMRTRRLGVSAAVLAVLMPTALGLYTWQSASVAARVLRPLSPTSTNPPDLMAAAEFLRRTVLERGHTLALDTDTGYLDIQLAFFARASERDTLRMRWPGFSKSVLEAPPDFVVTFEHGLLLREPWVRRTRSDLHLGDTGYRQIRSPAAGVEIFERVQAPGAARPHAPPPR